MALGIISLAVTLFVMLFLSSTYMASSSRATKVAAALAEEQLQQLADNPGAWDWASVRAASPGQLVRVAAAEETGAAVPAAMPLDRQADGRERAFLERFNWEAYARLPAAESSYVELTVVVHWQERERSRLVALTSAVPRGALEATT